MLPPALPTSCDEKGEEVALEEYDIEFSNALTDDPEEQTTIIDAFAASRKFDSSDIPLYQEYGSTLGYWYAVAKRRKRAANGDKQEWQFVEDYLEAGVKSLASALMASMSQNKNERFNGV